MKIDRLDASNTITIINCRIYCRNSLLSIFYGIHLYLLKFQQPYTGLNQHEYIISIFKVNNKNIRLMCRTY